MKKRYLVGSSLFLAMIFNACVSENTTTPVINENLPQITSIKTKSSYNAIAFEWNTSRPGEQNNAYFENIKGFKIYKGTKQDGPKKLIATIDNKYSTHYVDTKLDPNAVYYYEISTYDDNGISKPVAQEARTQDKIPPISFIQSIANLPNMIKIIWRPHDDKSVKHYNIYKNQLNSEKWQKVARVEGRLNVEFIDKVKPGEHFRYEVSAETFDGIESDRSKMVDSFAKVLPPSVINLSATNNAPKKIILTWDSANVPDFSHFNIYEKGVFSSNLLAKTKENTFTAEVDKDGITKTFEVSICDKDGLEGEKISISGSSLEKPQAPQITRARINNGVIELAWYPNDTRAKKFRIVREGNKEKKVFKDTTNTTFTDDTIAQGVQYYYYVIAIDEFDIQSPLSQKAVAQ